MKQVIIILISIFLTSCKCPYLNTYFPEDVIEDEYYSHRKEASKALTYVTKKYNECTKDIDKDVHMVNMPYDDRVIFEICVKPLVPIIKKYKYTFLQNKDGYEMITKIMEVTGDMSLVGDGL